MYKRQELASDEKGLELLGDDVVCDKEVTELEGMVDRCTLTTGVQTEFVIPGVNAASAVLHVARTVVRRGERTIIAAAEEIKVRDVLPVSYTHLITTYVSTTFSS